MINKINIFTPLDCQRFKSPRLKTRAYRVMDTRRGWNPAPTRVMDTRRGWNHAPTRVMDTRRGWNPAPTG
jgi:hypothetical protein